MSLGSASCSLLLRAALQAGVAVSKWAIEYEQPAADAFKLNNPDAAVFCNNCNAILVVSVAAALPAPIAEKACLAWSVWVCGVSWPRQVAAAQSVAKHSCVNAL